MTVPILLRGYATLFNVPVTVEGNEVEIIQQGAFANALDRPCALSFESHGDDAPRLGQTNLMFEDQHGLAFEAELAPNAGSMLAQIVSGKTALCSVCMTDRKYDDFDGAQIVTSSKLHHIAITSQAAYGNTAVWRADVPLDDAPYRIRQWAERWDQGYAAHIAKPVRLALVKPPKPVAIKQTTSEGSQLKRAALAAFKSSDAVTVRLLGGIGNPHHAAGRLTKSPAVPAPEPTTGKWREPHVVDLMLQTEDELVDRLIALEEKVAGHDEPSVLDMVSQCVDELTDRLIALETKVAKLEGLDGG